MGTVLYEYKFNFIQFLPSLIPLLVGLAFLFHKMVRNAKPFQRIISIIFRIVGAGVLVLGIAVTVGAAKENASYKHALEEDTALVVEGEVENYSLKELNDNAFEESFDLDGIHFRYGTGDYAGGYDSTKKDDGVITGNGQKLKVKYVHYDYDEETEGDNVILYIEQLN